MNPVRGTGSASAVTMTSWSALATITRSARSVSSAERRSTLRRSEIRTILARVSFSPEMSPTMSTWSPTAMARRPSSRARMAVTDLARVVPPSTRQVYRPRSTVITMPDVESSCAGRVFVRGLDRRDGRTWTSSLSQRSPRVLRTRLQGPRRDRARRRSACRPTSGRTRATSWRWLRCRRPTGPAPADPRSPLRWPSGGRRTRPRSRRSAGGG